MPVIPPAIGRKRQRVILRYTNDFGLEFLVRNDLIIDPDTNTYESPVTTIYFTRQVIGTGQASVNRREFEPRKFETCTQQDEKERIRTVVCPFADVFDTITQIEEIKTDYPSLRLRILREETGEIQERGFI